MSALDGIRIVDFSQMMQGPWATQKLGDVGADVIKVEPLDGELERTQYVGGELPDGISPWYLAMNRNKRGVAIDLKRDDGHRAAMDLLAEADVLVENFRSGVMDRLGLGYEDVREDNPEIVYVSATGYGEEGPYERRPAQDLLVQAMTGLAKQAGRADDPPTASGTFVADELSANLIALHTVVALFHRERTGEGQKVEANLLDATIDGICQEVTAALATDREFGRSEAGIAHPQMAAPYGIYETADGHVAISIGRVEQLADILGVEALGAYDTPRAQFDSRDEIYRLIASATGERRTEDLLAELLAADVWAAEVNDVESLPSNPQVERNDMIVEVNHPVVGTYETTGIPVSMSETPASIETPPPMVGEHTEEVLAEVGYSEAEVEGLLESGVVATHGDGSD